MKTVFLYAGQGSQKVGMGKDFYETYPEYREFIDSLTLPFDAKTLMHEGPLESLSQTEHTQACMAAFGAGVTMLLKKENITADAACGLSLGEYGALYCAGVFDAKEYVDLTAFRGQKMMEAAKGCVCSMSAVLGAKTEDVEAVCEAYDGPGYITVANYNCPGQVVICGDEEAVTGVEELLKGKGAKRCIRLNVSGPFHTKFMAPAGEALREYFAGITFRAPKIPVTMNVTGTYLEEGADIKELLIRQVQSSVRLESQLRTLIADGYERFVEIGPGTTISGFLKKTAKEMGAEIEIVGIDTVEDYKKLIGA